MSPSKNPSDQIRWCRIGDLYPDKRAQQHHFVALDGADQAIGIVRQIADGPQKGWLWSLTRVHAGEPFPPPRSGTTESHKEAALALVACWQRFAKWYGIKVG